MLDPGRPTISVYDRIHRPDKATVILVGTFLGIAVLANVFAAYFVSQEHYVYFWDYSGYWLTSLDLSASLLRDPVASLRYVVSSIRSSDYNLLLVLPIAPFYWIFGASRLTYILAITNVALLPGALVLGIVARRVLRALFVNRPAAPLMLAVASVLALHYMWMPALRGYPGVLGVLVIGGILLLHFAKPLAEQSLGRLVMTGLLLCLLVLVRRWYAFWVVAFFPALAIAQVFDIYHEGHEIRSRYIAATRNAVIVGLTFTAALFAVAAPFALRALYTDYSDIYSAWRFSSSVWNAARLVPLHFGWIVILFALLGLTLLSLRRETRVVGVFLIVQSATVFWLFARTQDFDVQHHYLLIPGIAVGVAVLALWLWTAISKRLWRIIAVGLVIGSLLVSSAVVFFPSAAGIAYGLGDLVPQVRDYPFNRPDLDVLGDLLDRLEQLEGDEQGSIYVLASSGILNSSIVQNDCRFGPPVWTFCSHVLSTNDVDKRDGFPGQFLDARYLIVGVPAQYHLRAKDQRVVGVLAREVTTGHGIGSSFERLPGVFKLDEGVEARLYRKVRPFQRGDLDALEQEFAGYYPDLREKFRVVDRKQ